MWGIIPAAGNGTRIQPLAFSKELLPVGSRREDGAERPRAVSEYLVERMMAAAAPTSSASSSRPASRTSSLLRRRGRRRRDRLLGPAASRPACATRCSARCPSSTPRESVLIGLPDTIWFPRDGLAPLADDGLSFLLFPVERPELFDAVVVDGRGRVARDPGQAARRRRRAGSGAPSGCRARSCASCTRCGCARQPRRVLGTLVNAGSRAAAARAACAAGDAYVDVGTLHGYRAALELLQAPPARPTRGLAATEPWPPSRRMARRRCR